jgi:preprotein translocase subunit SecG
MTFVYLFAVVLFLLLCLLLTVTVLLQESKSSGLGGASFGGDAGDSLFGVSTPQILKVFTGWLAAIFMVSCILLSYWTSAKGRSYSTVQTSFVAKTPKK